MLTLAVDTSNPTGSLSVLRDDALLGVISTSSDEPYSSRMFRQLEFLLSETRLALPQFDLFSVVAGPGSFTGLRVGLAAVKGWAEVYQRPIAAVSALEAIVAESNVPHGLIAGVIDARRGQFYGAVYKREQGSLRSCVPESVLAPQKFLELVRIEARGANVSLVSPSPELVTRALVGAPIAYATVCPVSPVLAPAVGRLGQAQAKRGQLVDALELDANYIRAPEAMIFRKGR